MKTFIMMWNPAISSFKKEEFENMVSAEWFELNWSVWDYKQVEDGDRFFLVRVGEGTTGIVMSGYIWSEPWEGEDWSGKGRKTFYVDLDIETILNPEKVPYVSTELLMKELPGFDWTGGHSGRVLPQELTTKLELLWADYMFANYEVFDDVNAQTTEFESQTELTSDVFEQYLQEQRGNACEVCGYDYKKVWGGDCDKANSYYAFFPNKGMKARSTLFLDHVHCICDSCNRLSTDKLRERLGDVE